MKDIFDYVDNHQDDAVDLVRRLCHQPSISAQNIGLTDMAQLLADMMEDVGIKTQILPTSGGPPVVYGELKGNSPYTLMFYDHYDVQPPEPLELWKSVPFEPVVKDGRIWGRGVADNKGNIAARLAAIKAFLKVRGSLPVSLKFCVEGDEEIGSPHLEAFVKAQRSLLQADGCIWEGAGVNWGGQPQVILGCKGILYVELAVRTANSDVHSSLATIVPNPAWRLVRILSSLKDANERVLIPGFYDDVVPPSQRDLTALDSLPLEDEDLKKNLGLKDLVLGLKGRDYLVRPLFQPTCNICGIVSGYPGEGSKTVLPAEARVKIDFRLVPRQTPEDIMGKLKAHLSRQGFDDVALATPMEGERPGRTPIDSPFVQAVAKAAEGIYSQKPAVTPTMAATGPMYCFTDILGQPVAGVGVENPDSRAHAPNENIRLEDLVQGTKHIAAIMDGVAALAKGNRR